MRYAHSANGSSIVATFAAGPLFVTGLALGTWLSHPGDIVDPNTIFPPSFLILLPFAAIFGAALAVAPTVIGATLMHRLGARNVAMRLPVAWILAGALAGGGAVAAFGGATATIVAFAFTGGGCALICRWRVRW